MKIEPISGPSITQPAGATANHADARAKAISMIQAAASGSAQEHPVRNPSSISPEEMTALKVRSNPSEAVESSPDGAKEETKPQVSDEPLSAHYANLARKERALRARAAQQEAALKAREAEFAAREEAFKAKDAEYSTKYIAKDRLTNDTLNALLDSGLTYDQITEAMLAEQGGQSSFSASREYKAMQAKIEQLEKLTEKTQKTFEEQQTSQYKQAITQIKSDASKLIYTDPNFETIKATNSINDVVELIERTFKEDGTLLSVEEAAQAVEDHLVEEAMKITKLKKIQQRMLQNASPATQKSTEAPKQQQLKTLTNAVSASGKLSARDRAVLAAEGRLNK